MKNIQVIDGAVNCDLHIWSASDADFRSIFPRGTDIEFVEDFFRRAGRKKAEQILERLWRRPVDKKKVSGIHGTLFFQLLKKKNYYPTKKELEIVTGVPPAFRKMLDQKG